MSEPLLSVENLVTRIETAERSFAAVDGVDFSIDRGETVCLVGESGSGKSLTCRSLTRLLRHTPARLTEGRITFAGRRLEKLTEEQLRRVRGDHLGHVFQEPHAALDPVYTIGEQLAEARDGDDRDRATAIAELEAVGMPAPAEQVSAYPHELSGGMAQRAAIAIGIAGSPALLIADEPTTAVDVTVQARLLDLFESLTGEGMAILLVTHDLRVASAIGDRIVVMHGGTVVERGPIGSVLERPAHPYTQSLLESLDRTTPRMNPPTRQELPADGCRFRAECPFAIEACEGGGQPAFQPVPGDSGRTVSCVYYGGDRDPNQILETSREPGGRWADR